MNDGTVGTIALTKKAVSRSSAARRSGRSGGIRCMEVTVKLAEMPVNTGRHWNLTMPREDSSKRDCQGAQRHEIKQYAAGAD